MKNIRLLVISLLIALLSACKTQHQSILISSRYDKAKNQTEYIYFPYGSASIPGEWERTGYNGISKQQFFKNADGISIAIAFGPIDGFEFNEDGSKKGFDFVSAFYEWEREYFTNDLHLEVEKIASDENYRYIIFRVHSSKIDSYFLLGERNNRFSKFSVSITDKWTKEEKINFLKNLYLEKNMEE